MPSLHATCTSADASTKATVTRTEPSWLGKETARAPRSRNGSSIYRCHADRWRKARRAIVNCSSRRADHHAPITGHLAVSDRA